MVSHELLLLERRTFSVIVVDREGIGFVLDSLPSRGSALGSPRLWTEEAREADDLTLFEGILRSGENNH